MAVTTNSTIEFESKEELNNYLTANGDAFSNVNYLIININGFWFVTIPRGSIVDSKVIKNTSFDASQGISLLPSARDIWKPGVATYPPTTTQKYISAKYNNPDIQWDHDNIKKLSQLELSYIKSATFSKRDGTQFIAYRDEFAQAWKDNHSSYMITHIEAWGVQPTKEK